MIKFSCGILVGILAIGQLQEIKSSGFKPWENRIDRSEQILKVVLVKVKN